MQQARQHSRQIRSPQSPIFGCVAEGDLRQLRQRERMFRTAHFRLAKIDITTTANLLQYFTHLELFHSSKNKVREEPRTAPDSDAYNWVST